jgi:hypothetical protein
VGDSPFLPTPPESSMSATGERERRRGWKRCSCSHVCEVEGKTVVVDFGRLNGIRGRADPICDPLEHTTSAPQIRSIRAIREAEHRAGDRWESGESDAKAQICANA